jgi:hypothetical protein
MARHSRERRLESRQESTVCVCTCRRLGQLIECFQGPRSHTNSCSPRSRPRRHLATMGPWERGRDGPWFAAMHRAAFPDIVVLLEHWSQRTDEYNAQHQSSFLIEEGVECLEKRDRGKKGKFDDAFPLRTMKVGDSFFITDEWMLDNDVDYKRMCKIIHNRQKAIRKYGDWTFKVSYRRTETGVQVWRSV